MRIVISNCISILIDSRAFIGRFMVRIGMVGRPISRCRSMVDRSRLVDGSRGMVIILLMGMEVV